MKMKPLELGLINEGRFLSDVDADLADITGQLVAFVKEYGTEAAKGATAELAVKITLAHEGPDETDFSIKAKATKKVPSRPASVTRAIGDQTQTGEPTLLVRASGSTHDTPHQRVLTTRDGRTVDADTGEILDEPDAPLEPTEGQVHDVPEA